MTLPGINSEALTKLREGDSKAVESHLKKVEDAIVLKRDLLDGKREELLETMKKPRDEVKQIEKIIKEVEETAGPDLLAELLALKVDARELVESIDAEYAMVKGLEEGGETIKISGVEKEIELEKTLENWIEHQLNLIADLQNLASGVVKKAKDHNDAGQKELISENAVNISDIASFISNVILTEELPNLNVAYNMLRLEEWPAEMERISKIEKRFDNVEPDVV